MNLLLETLCFEKTVISKSADLIQFMGFLSSIFIILVEQLQAILIKYLEILDYFGFLMETNSIFFHLIFLFHLNQKFDCLNNDGFSFVHNQIIIFASSITFFIFHLRKYYLVLEFDFGFNDL